MIANTDPERKLGMHWRSFLDTNAKDTFSFFFFDSFGSFRLLNFIVKNDMNIFNKVITRRFNQIFKQDQKIKLLRWTFKRENYKKLTSVETSKLSDTANHFFAFLNQFGEYKKNQQYR